MNKYYEVAGKALKHYGFENVTLTYLTEETNVIYQVTTDQQRYVLKIFEEASSCYEDNMAEAYLLDLLESTSLKYPRLVKTKEHESVLKVYCEEESRFKRLMMYEWMEGVDYETHETYDYFEELGEVMAQMHQATSDVILPPHIKPKKWDRVFFYKDEIPVYHMDRYKDHVSDNTKKIMNQVILILNERLKSIYETKTPQLIHGDLNPWNIKINEGKLHLIDYEEALFGFPEHDLATLLYYYQVHETLDYEQVKSAFIKGYRKFNTTHMFEEKTLQTLMISRRVNFMNYVLTIRENPKEFIEYSVTFVKRYIESYGG
ncbi:MAG: phosphotransferase [Clostridiales bacterium]|nr:phosphotransferase [Clostridiales bacterium]